LNEASPASVGGGLPVTCQYDALWHGFCYWHDKQERGVSIAELNGHRNLTEKLEDWTSIEEILEARAAKDALEYERQRQGVRALLDIGEDAL
jgi:hypothetical protein